MASVPTPSISSGGTILGMQPMTLASATLFTAVAGVAAWKYYNPIFETPIVGIDLFKGRYEGKLVQHTKKNISAVQCHKQALARKDKYKGFVHLNEKYSDPKFRNTCFFQTEIGDQVPLDTILDKNMFDSVTSGCLNVGEKLGEGCKGVGGETEEGSEQPNPETTMTPPPTEEKEQTGPPPPVKKEGFKTKSSSAPLAANSLSTMSSVDFGPKTLVLEKGQYVSKNVSEMPDGCTTKSIGNYATFSPMTLKKRS